MSWNKFLVISSVSKVVAVGVENVAGLVQGVWYFLGIRS